MTNVARPTGAHLFAECPAPGPLPAPREPPAEIYRGGQASQIGLMICGAAQMGPRWSGLSDLNSGESQVKLILVVVAGSRPRLGALHLLGSRLTALRHQSNDYSPTSSERDFGPHSIGADRSRADSGRSDRIRGDELHLGARSKLIATCGRLQVRERDGHLLWGADDDQGSGTMMMMMAAAAALVLVAASVVVERKWAGLNA